MSIYSLRCFTLLDGGGRSGRGGGVSPSHRHWWDWNTLVLHHIPKLRGDKAVTKAPQSGTIHQRQEARSASWVELLMLVNCSSTTHTQKKNFSELKSAPAIQFVCFFFTIKLGRKSGLFQGSLLLKVTINIRLNCYNNCFECCIRIDQPETVTVTTWVWPARCRAD